MVLAAVNTSYLRFVNWEVSYADVQVASELLVGRPCYAIRGDCAFRVESENMANSFSFRCQYPCPLVVYFDGNERAGARPFHGLIQHIRAITHKGRQLAAADPVRFPLLRH